MENERKAAVSGTVGAVVLRWFPCWSNAVCIFPLIWSQHYFAAWFAFVAATGWGAFRLMADIAQNDSITGGGTPYRECLGWVSAQPRRKGNE